MDQKFPNPHIALQNISWNSLQLGSLLGHGGYGDVYRATWHGTNVAVKQLHLKTLAMHFEEEFTYEAQVMAQCQFPNIVEFYGVCTEVGHTALVMEYMPKGSLYGILQNKAEELPWSTRWSIAIDIGKGIHYLHCRHILHHDLKSSNVLLGDQYKAKLCDFGLSKIKLEKGSTINGKVSTVRWRAPETFKRGYKPSTAMDIYSYGMVLWEIASRAIPFADGDEQTVISWLRDGEKENIPEECPEAYGDVIKKCWLEPLSRPSAQEITEIFEKTRLTFSLPSQAELKKSEVAIEKSWHFDPLTERKADPLKLYQLLEATNKDKMKVVSFYQHHPVPGYEIGSVEVIYNREFNQGFELQIKKLQQRHNNPAFMPKWRNENDAIWREKIHNQLETLSKPYVDSEYPAVKLLPLWHGTKPEILDSLFKTGYASLATTDSGFFGKGIYGAWEAEYSHRVYSKGALVLNWAAFYSAYPVIDGDKDKLKEKGNYANYDAHFVPVAPRNPHNPNEVNYEPCKPNQKQIYTEMVIFNEAACLPRFLVRLQLSGPQPNPLNSQPVIHQTTALGVSESFLDELGQVPTQVSYQIIGSKQNFFQSAALKTIDSTLQQTTSYSEQVVAISKQAMVQVDIQDLSDSLKWTTEGHLVEIERLLNKNSMLALTIGTVKDLSNRTFQNITILQYAAWALDIEMCQLITKYMEPQNALIQLKALSEDPEFHSMHGAYYNVTPLIAKIKIYLENYNSWNGERCRYYWQKEIGGEQRKCPAWLIYAWCEEGENAAWLKKDFTCKVTREYNKHLVWWMTSNHNLGCGVGSTWAVSRGTDEKPQHGKGKKDTPGALSQLSRLLTSGRQDHDLENLQFYRQFCHDSLERLKINLEQNILDLQQDEKPDEKREDCLLM